MRPLALLVLFGLTSACLVQRPRPDEPAPSATRETRTSSFPDGSRRSEWNVLVWPDGRTERDGREREYHPNGALRSEGSFERGAPVGVWRTWFPDGTPRSEVDFGAPGSPQTGLDRFWHANGRPAAEGPAIRGVREGRWTFWSENGLLAREGVYRAGRREGTWVFYDELGARRGEGLYASGERVGSWTLWDEHGVPHARPAAEVDLGDP
jgi:hypothetical protein